MPTNEERKAVAARLRECIGLHEFAEVFGFSWTDESDWYWRDVTAKVADYVEPEPERTCHVDRRVPGAAFCDECAKDWEDDWVYCPKCGRKAVE